MTKWESLIVAMVASLTSVLAAQPRSGFLPAGDQRRDRVAAATARAVDRLKNEIAQEQVSRNVTVGDVLEATGGTETLLKTLQRAQMIGGPRWLDDQTCQVRLEISGPRVAAALVDIATTHQKKSPLAPELLAGRLRQWDNRTFIATSTSTGAAAVQEVKPVETSPAWAQVPDAARKQAVSAARTVVENDALRAIAPIPLVNGKTVGETLNDARVRGAVDQWFASRPVTQIEFRDDLQVVVTLSTPGGQLADAYRAALESAPASVRPDEPTWSRIRKAFEDRVPASSRGSARAGALSVTRASSITLPATPPPWVNEQIDAGGSGTSSKSPLKAARAAEVDAQARLRGKIAALEVMPGLTVADAARQDPRIADAVNRAVSRARTSRVEYQGDGSAAVRVNLDLHEVWDALCTSE